MSAPISVFSLDLSRRWIIAPGVASTRQIQVRNDSGAAIECHLKVEEPSAASVSPATVTLDPRQSRNVDVIVLADWTPANDKRVVISVRDEQGNLIVNFAQDIIAADGSDCSVTLTWKEPVVLDNVLSGLKFYCTITSRSASTRNFEIDFTPHPALRFPERKKVTLEPGESSSFEVPIEWRRSVHDATGWNHPRVIEVIVPVSQGRRTAVVLWESVEPNIAQYLTDDDRAPTATLPPEITGTPPFPGFVEQPGSDADYQRLLSLKQLEQSVVGPAQVRSKVVTPPELERGQRKRISPATAILVLALLALAIGAVFYLHPSEPGPAAAPYQLRPVPLGSFSSAPAANKSQKKVQSKATPHATLTASSIAVTSPPQIAPAAVLPPVKQHAIATAAPIATATAAAAAPAQPAPPPLTKIDRGATVVALADPEVRYVSGGRAVAVRWYVQGQDHALVHVLNDRSVIVAQSSVPGNRSHTIVRLPLGYHGGLSVEVIAIGFHGERVVQSAYLSPTGM